MKHQGTYNRVFGFMNQGKEPKGHCEAMTNRCHNSIEVANRGFEKELGKQNRSEQK